ncbi:hypothetical protein ACRQFU_00290 [Actinotignum sp. GS-2025c]|uniref:hypothetical protein n=1 Tax=Actinotignum sp. GS-2025c TaxID=3427276 RepID=UPI003F4674BE
MIDHFHKSFMLILRRAVLRNINNILQIFGALAFMAQFRAVRRRSCGDGAASASNVTSADGAATGRGSWAPGNASGCKLGTIKAV